jgi:hypothetical protein
MKAFFAFGLCIFASAGFGAQVAGIRSGTSPGITVPSAGIVPSAGALGGFNASVPASRPLGGVALPTFPVGVNNRHKRAPAPGYVTPIYYVPNYYGSGYYDNPQSGYQQAPPPDAPAPATQPIIINQYFGSRGPGERAEERYGEDYRQPAPPPDDVANPGDPIGPPQNYYLIAYRDHTVYSALAYWVEGDTLHYVTTQNTHNQASLALIDLDRTTKLNADRSIPFSIPGK